MEKKTEKPPWFERADVIHRERVSQRGHNLPYDFNDIVYLTMGLAGEAGEVANEVKKAMRISSLNDSWAQPPGKDLAKADFVAKVREEIADTGVYLELLAHAIDVWDGTEANWTKLVLEKMEKRFAAR
jgi:NTP pyrophosphatase (non-canonical NTP hydrolase)